MEPESETCGILLLSMESVKFSFKYIECPPRARRGMEAEGHDMWRGLIFILVTGRLNRRFRNLLEPHRVSGTGTWNLDVTGLVM